MRFRSISHQLLAISLCGCAAARTIPLPVVTVGSHSELTSLAWNRTPREAAAQSRFDAPKDDKLHWGLTGGSDKDKSTGKSGYNALITVSGTY
jgi:hypothetical protein